jgi:hypothetical protein
MDLKQLLTAMKEATKQLHEVDVSVEPSRDDLELYQSLREAASQLKSVTNYILEG